MRWVAEQWAPEYGTPMGDGDLDPAEADVDVDVEVPAAAWRPMCHEVAPARSVLFVDGVQRIDARVWVSEDGERVRPGWCASVASGAVWANGGHAEVMRTAVERCLVTASGEGQPIATGLATWELAIVGGDGPDALRTGVHQRMTRLEGVVAAEVDGAELIVVDGPLRAGASYPPAAVGYVKTHDAGYLPESVAGVVGQLGVGERTPLFCISQRQQSKLSWYSRLPGGRGHAWAGVVRCEIRSDGTIPDAIVVADRTSATLPRFASRPHRDPRAPQNLVPIGALENRLRHLLGDRDLLYRALLKAQTA